MNLIFLKYKVLKPGWEDDLCHTLLLWILAQSGCQGWCLSGVSKEKVAR
ncbi:hypothetical protein [Aetokthonos hydrillicola]